MHHNYEILWECAGLALLGLRNDNSPEYMEKQYNIARARDFDAQSPKPTQVSTLGVRRSSCTGSPAFRAASSKRAGARAPLAQALA